MDVLKNMFASNKSGGGQPGDNNKSHPKAPSFGDEFRKPVWIDDCESDDELYGGNNSSKVFAGFQVFTNPLEMQRHFEQQVDEMMRSLHHFEVDDDSAAAPAPHFNDNARANYLKPGFEDLFAAAAAGDDKTGPGNATSAAPTVALDSDLDDEIYADQLHSLLQRISPNLDAFLQQQQRPSVSAVPSIKSSLVPQRGARFALTTGGGTGAGGAPLTDEQQVLNLLHGTASVGNGAGGGGSAVRGKKSLLTPAHGGIFEGVFQGPKVFRQSVMTQTVRRPDGTVETRRVVRDADGNTNTTVTKTSADGVRSSETTSNCRSGGGCFEAKPPPGGLPANGTAAAAVAAAAAAAASVATAADRNVYVTKEGYAMPMNIW